MTRPSARELFEHRGEVPTEFDAVAKRYDLMVGLNPGYSRHLRMSAARLGAPLTGELLDLCCGTGLSTAALASTFPRARITGLDGSAGMLLVARRKPTLAGVRFVHGDAMDPAAAGAAGPYDGILMAYGIRNMPDIDRCLATLRSLLVPGGRVVFHEYSVADSRVSQLLWHAIAGGVIVPLGLLTSPRSDIYRYLWRSVLAFDGVRAFEERLGRAGFVDVQTLPMDGWQKGVVHSFVASNPR